MLTVDKAKLGEVGPVKLSSFISTMPSLAVQMPGNECETGKVYLIWYEVGRYELIN